MFRASKALFACLRLLRRAREYAEDLSCDPWKFAVEWRYLKARGLETTDARWLYARGFIEVRREISSNAAFERVFMIQDVPRLSRDAAFIITTSGDAFYKSLLENEDISLSDAVSENDESRKSLESFDGPSEMPADAEDGSPVWDSDRRELTFAGQVVKRYRVPSPNQELILKVFQEEHWPAFIDDPLPPLKDVDSLTRLQATVKSLNRSQVNRLIRFSGNGGRKVLWEAIP